jgi:hypothetical protein
MSRTDAAALPAFGSQPEPKTRCPGELLWKASAQDYAPSRFCAQAHLHAVGTTRGGVRAVTLNLAASDNNPPFRAAITDPDKVNAIEQGQEAIRVVVDTMAGDVMDLVLSDDGASEILEWLVSANYVRGSTALPDPPGSRAPRPAGARSLHCALGRR